MTEETSNAALEEEVTVDTEIVEPTEPQAETATAPDEGFVPTDNERVQARFNKMTAEKYAETRRADALQLEINNLKAAKTSDAKEPVLEDFDYDEQAHTSAMIDYKVNLKAEQIQKEQLETAQVAQQNTAADEVYNQYDSQVADFAVKKPDYNSVIANLPEFPSDTYQMLLKTNPETVYNLAGNLELAYEIAGMSTVDAALRIGQITAVPKATIKTSAAPEPISPINTGSGPVGDEWDEVADGCTFE